MSSLVMTEQLPWLPAARFLEQCHLCSERALGLLMPEPHKKPPVWEVAGMAKAHPQLREGREGWYSGQMFRNAGV